MQLTICPECQESVGPHQPSCPRCGAPLEEQNGEAKGREIVDDEEKQSRRRFRIYCVVVMLLGVVMWFIGVVSVTFIFMIVGGAIAVSAGCALKLEWFD